MADDGSLLVLVLSNGMPSGDLSFVLSGLREKSKSIGTHKRRELYWQAYSKMLTTVGSIEGQLSCFLLFRTVVTGGIADHSDGTVELVELTKRQRGLVNGGCEILGHKLKHPEKTDKAPFCVAFSEEDAAAAWDDFMTAEPCIYLSADGVYVASRYKRVLCKGLSGTIKTMKELEQIVCELAPDRPLKSISFIDNTPPPIKDYNVFLVGPSPLSAALPTTIGHLLSISASDIYDYFLRRRNLTFIFEAEKLIKQMLTDVAKGEKLVLISASSKKEASVAYKNSLMKRVFLHESNKKFIDIVRRDGLVELVVIKGSVDNTDFGRYGGIVCELFYRVDFSIYE